jgi:hydrogenase-4 component F
MTTETSLLLPLIPFIPLMAALFVALGETTDAGRRAAFVVGTVPPLVLGGILVARLVTPHGGQPLILTAWGGFIYADVLSALMICCTFLVVASVGIYSFVYIQHDVDQGLLTESASHLYYSLLLVFSAFMTWTVIVSHLFFMFLVIEIATIAVSFLVATYKTKYALIASFKYNLLVVMAMLFAVMGAVFIFARMTTVDPTLSRIHVLEMGKLASLLPVPLALTIVACFLCAFGTKGGMMPFHSWLPDAHSEAPAPISALLSGLVIVVGPFGIARTVTLFSPHYTQVVVLAAAFGCASIVVGILLAIVQNDLKRLLAYSTISQVGYVFAGLGLGSYLGIYGGLFHAVTHLLAKALLFFCAGAIIYRLGIRRISDLGGLSRKMPITSACFFVGCLSIGGLPFFAGFPSKYTVVLALAEARVWWALALAALGGLVFAAHRVFWGEESPKVAALAPAAALEMPLVMMVPMISLAAGVVVLGVYPQALYPILDSGAKSILALVGQ